MSYIVLRMPEPEYEEPWCQACAAFLKALVNDAHGEEIRTALANGKAGAYIIRPDVPAGALQPAVVRGICAELQQFGMLDLCWHHLGGITIDQSAPSTLARGGQLPPGFARGHG